MRLPSVTIAIPTRNRVSYLHQALDSALSQTYPLLQVIVSDNCSDDGTAEAVSEIRDQRLVFLRQTENLGMVGNWNACVERATGELFLLLSDDDYLEPQAIEKLVDALGNSSDREKVGVVCCRAWEVDQNGRKLRIDPAPPAREDAMAFALEYLRGNRKMHLCSTLLRTEDLRQIGAYTQGSVALAIDAIVWSRILLRRGIFLGVGEPLASYRVHASRTTNSSGMKVWQHDIQQLVRLWAEAFRNSSTNVRNDFAAAARHYESWEIAAIINSSAHSVRERLQALRAYWSCRASFHGLIGGKNLVGGIIKLVAPEHFKRPIRTFLLRRARPYRSSAVAPGLWPSRRRSPPEKIS